MFTSNIFGTKSPYQSIEEDKIDKQNQSKKTKGNRSPVNSNQFPISPASNPKSIEKRKIKKLNVSSPRLPFRISSPSIGSKEVPTSKELVIFEKKLGVGRFEKKRRPKAQSLNVQYKSETDLKEKIRRVKSGSLDEFLFRKKTPPSSPELELEPPEERPVIVQRKIDKTKTIILKKAAEAKPKQKHPLSDLREFAPYLESFSDKEILRVSKNIREYDLQKDVDSKEPKLKTEILIKVYLSENKKTVIKQHSAYGGGTAAAIAMLAMDNKRRPSILFLLKDDFFDPGARKYHFIQGSLTPIESLLFQKENPLS